jgi:hypothetical protein
MDPILWENASLFSLPVELDTERAAWDTSVLRRDRVELLTECRLRDFRMIPVGRSVPSPSLLLLDLAGLACLFHHLLGAFWFAMPCNGPAHVPRSVLPSPFVLDSRLRPGIPGS